MSIIAWIVLGAIAGYLAGFFVSGDEGLGVIGHIVLGIVGALVGGFLASVLFNTKPIDGAFDISSIVAATHRCDHRRPRGRHGHPGHPVEFGLTPHGRWPQGSPVDTQLTKRPPATVGVSLCVAPPVTGRSHLRRSPPAMGMQRDRGASRSARDTRSPTLLRVGPRATGGPGADDPVRRAHEHRDTRNAAAMPMLSWLSGLHQRRIYREAPQPHRIDNLDRQ